MIQTATDRFLVTLFIIVGVLVIILFFSRQTSSRGQAFQTVRLQQTAPASSGNVVRAFSNTTNNPSLRTTTTRSSNSYTYYTYTNQPGTTTYYEN